MNNGIDVVTKGLTSSGYVQQPCEVDNCMLYSYKDNRTTSVVTGNISDVMFDTDSTIVGNSTLTNCVIKNLNSISDSVFVGCEIDTFTATEAMFKHCMFTSNISAAKLGDKLLGNSIQHGDGRYMVVGTETVEGELVVKAEHVTNEGAFLTVRLRLIDMTVL